MTRLLGKTNSLLKDARRLQDARERRQTGRFLIEGLRALKAAREASFPLETLLLAPQHEALAREWPEATVFTVDPEALEKASPAQTSQGILGIARIPPETNTWHDLVLVLDGLSDPGNLGTLLRAARAVAPCTVVVGEGVDPYSPKVVRASAGTLFSLPIARTIPELPEHKVFSAVVRDGQPLYQTRFPAKSVIMLGNEAHGLARTPGTPLTLPMAPDCESLNVAMAGTVLLYEYRRQIGFLPSG